MNCSQHKSLRGVERKGHYLSQLSDDWFYKNPIRSDISKKASSYFTRPQNAEGGTYPVKTIKLAKTTPVKSRSLRNLNYAALNENPTYDAGRKVAMQVSSTGSTGQGTTQRATSRVRPAPLRRERFPKYSTTVRRNIPTPTTVTPRRTQPSSYTPVPVELKSALLDTVHEILTRAENVERAQMEKHLSEMQQYRRAFVYDAVQDNKGYALKNLNSLLNAINRPLISFNPEPSDTTEYTETTSKERTPASTYEYNDYDYSDYESVGDHDSSFQY